MYLYPGDNGLCSCSLLWDDFLKGSMCCQWGEIETSAALLWQQEGRAAAVKCKCILGSVCVCVTVYCENCFVCCTQCIPGSDIFVSHKFKRRACRFVCCSLMYRNKKSSEGDSDSIEDLEDQAKIILHSLVKTSGQAWISAALVQPQHRPNSWSHCI